MKYKKHLKFQKREKTTMNKSMIEGTTWRWRLGQKKMPRHSFLEPVSFIRMLELYTPVQDEKQAQFFIRELRKNEIELKSKRTHSPNDPIPSGTLIVYAPLSQPSEFKEGKENIEKLKSYILKNGGKITETQHRTFALKKIIQNLFGRR